MDVPLPDRAERPIAFVGVEVVPMSVPGTVGDRTVIVDRGRITAIGPAREVNVAGCHVVDGRNRYLMPGLADMHVHWNSFTYQAMYLANGVTTVRNMWGAPWHLAMSRAIDEGRFPGPRLVTTSPGFDGVLPGGGTIWPGTIVGAAGDVAQLVEQAAARGYHQIKAYELLEPETLRAIGAAAGRARIDVVGHCPETVTMEQAIDAGMRCFEHMQNIHIGRLRGDVRVPTREEDRLGRIKTIAERLDIDSVAALAGRMRDEQVWSCPTLTMWDGHRPSSVDENHPLLRYAPPDLARGWWSLDGRGLGDLDPDAYEDGMTAWRGKLGEAVAILHEAGAPLLLGTDHDNPWVFAGFAIHDEISNLIAAGLSPYETLRLGTVEAARFLGEAGQWGEVTVGARGDLVLVDGNPLVDPSALRHPAGVLVNRWFLDRGDLDRLLEHHAAIYARTDDPVPAGHRVLDMTLSGTKAGCCTYRHESTAEGDQLIEEDEREFMNHTSTRARLSPDGAIKLLRMQRSIPPFTETTTVSHTSAGYEVEVEAVDGVSERSVIDRSVLFPHLVTTVPLLPEGEVDVLIGDYVKLHVAAATVTASDGRKAVEITDPAQAATRSCTANDSGEIAQICDTYLGSRRAWSPRS